MSWDIICGIITLVTFFLAVGGVLVKLTRTLAVLESTVRELKDFITRQSGIVGIEAYVEYNGYYSDTSRDTQDYA